MKVRYADDVLGVDASAMVPLLSMFTGGGAKPGAAPNNEVKALQLQMEQMRRESEERKKYMVIGAVGVGLFGMLYLLLKK